MKRVYRGRKFVFAAAAILLLSLAARDWLPAAYYKWPLQSVLPFQKVTSAWVNWLLRDMLIAEKPIMTYTRQVSELLSIPLRAIQHALATGWLIEGKTSAETYRLPPVSWVSIIALGCYLGYRLRGFGLSALVGGSLAYFALFGLWEAAMLTLSSVVITVALGLWLGGAIGTAAWASPRVSRTLEPVFDIMQTMPVFSYLVPILLLFGFGPVSAILVSLIYSIPPMARATEVALKAVPSEIDDLAAICGATRFQRITKLIIPSARDNLLIGVNQMIMACLAMVMLASLIGAGGLGGLVLEGLQRLRFGRALEAGLAISIMAICLYRLVLAFTKRRPSHLKKPGHWKDVYIVAGTVVVPTVLGVFYGVWASFPPMFVISTEWFWTAVINTINAEWGGTLNATRTLIVVNILAPTLEILRGIGWGAFCIAFLLLGFAVRKPALGVISAITVVLVSWFGYWDATLVTFHMVAVGIVLAVVIGVPLGIWSAYSDKVRCVFDVVIDTIQTLPTLVYLIPVVMLLGPGSVSAIIAISLYVIATIVRYTDHALRSVPPSLVEAANVCGATTIQELMKVRAPVAIPTIMLGLNQAVLLGVSMVVVTALIGTRGLEQETITALSRVDPGRGLVAGLIVSIAAILTDRFIRGSAAILSPNKSHAQKLNNTKLSSWFSH